MGLEPRVIPVLQLENERFVKTKSFTKPVYVGDPINVLSIFNELAVDELVVIDILASDGTNSINYDFLSRLSSHCFVPLSYGGGINTLEQATKVVALGFEKVVINTAIMENSHEVERIVKSLGSASVTAGLDVQLGHEGQYEVWYSGGNKRSSLSIELWCQLASKIGVGEVLVTSIDREGTGLGYDFGILEEIVNRFSIPVILNGGASNRENISKVLINKSVSAAAGSLFVFQSGRDSTLINYPSREELSLMSSGKILNTHLPAMSKLLPDPVVVRPNNQRLNSVSCQKCLITSDVPNSGLEESAVCHYCAIHDQLEVNFPNGEKGKVHFDNFISELKESGKGKQYDCIMGVSGGTDSSYLAHVLVKNGIRPLAVHFDNTWNSPIATQNIYAVLDKLGVPLETFIVDNAEYDDLYKSFLSAGVKDIEAPTDIGFMGVLYRSAEKHGIKTIVEGHSFRTEGVSPMGWLYMDGGYIKDVHKKFGQRNLRTYPNMSFFEFMKWTLFSGIRRVRPLYWLEYNKTDAKEFLATNYGWKWYGGHHLENRFTAFYHSYFLPKRFGIDFRQIELSALVRSKQLTYEEGLIQLHTPRTIEVSLLNLVKNRLGYSDEEFNNVMDLPHNTYKNFKTYKTRFELLKPLFWVLLKLNRVPESFYVKFCKR